MSLTLEQSEVDSTSEKLDEVPTQSKQDSNIILGKFNSVDELGKARLSVQADRDAQKAVFERTKIGGIPAGDLQKAMDEEVYAEYLRFLLALSPEVALAHVDHDPLFLYNLSTTYFQKLLAKMEKRGWRV